MRKTNFFGGFILSVIFLAAVLASFVLSLPIFVILTLISAIIIYTALAVHPINGLFLAVLTAGGGFFIGGESLPLFQAILLLGANIIFMLIFLLFKGIGSYRGYFSAMISGAAGKCAALYLVLNYLFTWLDFNLTNMLTTDYIIVSFFTSICGGFIAVLVDAILGGERIRSRQRW
jgi:hypothetical protein